MRQLPMARQRTSLQLLAAVLYLLAPVLLLAQANDNFANRAQLAGGSITITADNSAATTEPGEPINTNVMGKTLWWTWTAPASGWVTVNVAPQPVVYFGMNSFYAMLWRGDSITRLTHLASVTNFYGQISRPRDTNACLGTLPCRPPVPGNIYVQAGDTLQISVAAQRSGTNDNARPFTLTLDLSTLELAYPPHDTVLAGPTNLVARITAPRPDIEGNVTNVSFAYFKTNANGSLQYLGSVRVTNALEATFVGLESSDYWFYAQATNEAGRALTTPAHFVRVRPRNDHFHEATQVTTLPFYDQFNLNNSTAEPNEPILPNQVTAASVWWRWTPPANSEVIVRSWGGPIGVFTGNSLESLLPHAFGSNTLRATFQAGTTYFFKVASGTSAHFSRSFELHHYPSNDDFANSTVLVGPGAVQTGDFSVATREPFEPDGSGTLWWTWTAPTDGVLNIRAVNSAPFYCAVYTGNALSNLVYEASQTFGWFLPSGDGNSTISREILRLEVSRGQTYHFKLGTYWGTRTFTFTLDLCTMQITTPGAESRFQGSTNLAVEVSAPRPEIEGSASGMMIGIRPSAIYSEPGPHAAPLSAAAPFTGTLTNLPPGSYQLIAWGTNAAGRFISTPTVPIYVAPWNDNFASAQPLSGWITLERFWLDNSSVEAGEPEMGDQRNHYSVWWKWTAPSNSAVLIQSFPPITVFEGESLQALRRVGHVLEGFDLALTRFNAIAGTTYYLRAAANFEGSGLFIISPPPVVNDDFANSIRLYGTDTSFVVTNGPASIEPGEPLFTAGSLWWTWVSPADGTLALQLMTEWLDASFEAFSGTNLINLDHRPWFYLPFGTGYRVLAGEQINLAFNNHHSTNTVYRLLFVPDPPPNRLQLVQVNPQEVSFVIRAEPGEEVTIEASSDLQYWHEISFGVASEPIVCLGLRSISEGDYTFFRAVRRPAEAGSNPP